MVSPPQVFVYEFITGGGWPPGELPPSLAVEGGAMAWALLADFRAWGAVHTVTTLDLRLANLTLPADEVVRVAPGQHEAVFSSLLARSDAALLIAPETDGILTRLSDMVKGADVPLLGSSPVAVAIAGDKWVCYQRFRQAGLPTPLTHRVSFADAPQAAREIGYPLVTKPVDGVGCQGVCLVARGAELAAALSLLRRVTHREEILLQRFVAGTHASVSLLVAEGRALPLSLNGQEIETGCPFAYRGGVVPLAHPAKARAFAVARAAVGLVPGLQGYVGVDLVLSEEEALLMEINPRLTTSYIGLRQVLRFNLAQAIWKACRQGVLPERVLLTGQVSFSKAELSQWEGAL
jgi:predicted ATP-grasp superfamily ATP-dependent carboligase